MSLIRDFQRASRSLGAPVTVALIAAIAAGFLAAWLDAVPQFLRALPFRASDFLSTPWTALTFPFAFFGDAGLLSALFACLWLWGIGGIVEREEGSARFAALWAAASILAALGLWIGSQATGNDARLASPWTPLAALTVVWGARHPDMPVRFMFVLMITAKWVAWISAALVFFGTRPPAMAPFSAVPLVVAYLYASRKLPLLRSARKEGDYVRGSRTYDPKYFDDVKRRQRRREEQERLRKLFEQSISEDEDRRQDS